MNYGPLEFAAYLQQGARGVRPAPEPACVRELVSTRTSAGEVRVRVRRGGQPLVLVLSSHQDVLWRIELQRGARLEAVLLAGAGKSMVRGTRVAPVASIGGFYAFRRGSIEFRHLEDEVMRCTRRGIRDFQGMSAADLFEVAAP